MALDGNVLAAEALAAMGGQQSAPRTSIFQKLMGAVVDHVRRNIPLPPPQYVVGDLFYANSPNTLVRLPYGTDGNVLTGAGGIPSWAAPSGGSGGSNITADTHPTSATVYDDEFEGANLDLTGSRFSGAQAWSWFEQTPSANAVLKSGSLVLTPTPQSGTSLRMLEQSLSGTGTWAVKLSSILTENYDFFGLYMRSSARFCGVRVQNDQNGVSGTAGSLGAYILVSSWTNYTTNNSPVIAQSLTYEAASDSYLAIRYDGTSLYFMWSPNGIAYYTIYSATAISATLLPGAPTAVGLLCDAAGYTNPAGASGVFDWFRKIA